MTAVGCIVLAVAGWVTGWSLATRHAEHVETQARLARRQAAHQASRELWAPDSPIWDEGSDTPLFDQLATEHLAAALNDDEAIARWLA